jgi:hypothetical protein
MDKVSVTSTLFNLLPTSKTGIDFENNVVYEEEFNVYTYRNFYNGAGVGIGDINNDGLVDIYFCGNQESNRLYLNKGNFKFEDITIQARVACENVWSTGVSMVDINGDGYLDIFVCKSGSPEGENRHNELFINNGDLSFTDRSEDFELDDIGLSNHAAFFDYDKDGDLDCYLLNNSFDSFAAAQLKKDLRNRRDPSGANKLLRNEGDHFVDVSEEAGIYGSAIGFGLGVTIGDINKDGWQDIYVSNDFFERDYLYINNRDGTFNELLEEQINEISLGSMGADIADINNDAYPEIFVTEMLPQKENRLKTKAMFESWQRYQQNVEMGYHHQFARNVLQLNNQDNTFSEIGRLAGVDATDWSWSASIWDMDNDGWKDIFVANGIFKDLLDQDYIGLYTDPNIMRSMMREDDKAILKLIDAIPSEKISNYAFRNNQDLTFKDHAEIWGLGSLSHSNGSAFGDLDNDGDLDLVVNNVNMLSFVYKNNSIETSEEHFIQFKLIGTGKNKDAIGSQVVLKTGGKKFYQELIPTRGFMSSVDPIIHFGLGEEAEIDSALIFWPDDKVTILTAIKANQRLEIKQTEANATRSSLESKTKSITFFENISDQKLINHRHVENDFIDFSRDKLLYHMLSAEGPKICKGDVNGDGLLDVYIGGSKNHPGALMIQLGNGNFIKTNTPLFESDAISEDTDCIFFDVDNDNDLDLYVASGGYEYSSSSYALMDRLYINDGKGKFSRSPQQLPAGKNESTSCVDVSDIDGDGDYDLFVGIRLRPFLYGVPTSGYILLNDGNGRFEDYTQKIAPDLVEVGMITDALWSDIDRDEDPDLVIVGEWMPLTVFRNEQGQLENITIELGLENTLGWWNCLEEGDLDRDGDPDFVLGNHGLNSRFKCSIDQPVKMYVNDFDRNGKIEHIYTLFNGNKEYPMAQQVDVIRQLPSLQSKYPSFHSYKEQSISDMFSEEILNTSIVKEASNLRSSILINHDGIHLELKDLPLEAQFSPIYAIMIHDFNNDDNADILTGGNFYRAKPEAGKYDASYGCLLIGDGKGNFDFMPNRIAGLTVKGEIRDFEIIEDNNILIVAKNNDYVEIFKYQE